MEDTRQKKYIFWVRFKECPEGFEKKDFFFNTIAAIFSVFTEKQIGTNRNALWRHGLRNGNEYYGKYCSITAERLFHNPQK